MPSLKLSVAILTFNEERILQTTLNAIHDIADEIVILDSFSTDRTKEICHTFPKVRFHQATWKGIGPQKNILHSLCQGEWILLIDADEEVKEELKTEIMHVINNPKETRNVFNIKLRNYVFGKYVKYGGWGNVWRVRFFRQGTVSFTDDVVHEKIVTTHPIYHLKGHISHHTYSSVFHHLQKINSYSEDMSKKLFLQGKRSNIISLTTRPFYHFICKYIFKLGFLDGVLGFYLAVMDALYTFLKYFKLYNMQLQRRK